MKLMILAIVLALSLTGFAIIGSNAIVEGCDKLLLTLESSDDVTLISDAWEKISRTAAYVTPYDLIRNADQNAENFFALLSADADPADVEAARQILIASILQIRRIHALNWEVIL